MRCTGPWKEVTSQQHPHDCFLAVNKHDPTDIYKLFKRFHPRTGCIRAARQQTYCWLSRDLLAPSRSLDAVSVKPKSWWARWMGQWVRPIKMGQTRILPHTPICDAFEQSWKMDSPQKASKYQPGIKWTCIFTFRIKGRQRRNSFWWRHRASFLWQMAYKFISRRLGPRRSSITNHPCAVCFQTRHVDLSEFFRFEHERSSYTQASRNASSLMQISGRKRLVMNVSCHLQQSSTSTSGSVFRAKQFCHMQFPSKESVSGKEAFNFPLQNL